MPDLDATGATRFEINLGSNILRNSNGVISIQGREQIVIEQVGSHLFLTMDLFDATGQHIAHLRRNRWAFNTGERYSLQTSSPTIGAFAEGTWLRVLERRTDRVVLEIMAQPDGHIQILNGHFHTHRGDLVELTPHVCRIGTNLTLFGDVRECRGGAVVVG